jgi:hypothetical protein
MTIGFESGATAMLGAVLATPFLGRLALLGSKGGMEIRDRDHPENSYPTTFTGARLGAAGVAKTRSNPARKTSSALPITCSLSSSTGDS